eukprot:TRINITY_DN60951_c0_g1_i1.p1 TRINITY_DN60951_c0_g1~~TRINITY_DN60951_c0_g1_i1.p1  ORF type:complete len:360 (+),score=41.91 TRINITY_DN60951_c0_g1_i1:98-1177(+)
MRHKNAAEMAAVACGLAVVAITCSGCGGGGGSSPTSSPTSSSSPSPASSTRIFGVWAMWNPDLATQGAAQLRNPDWAGVFDVVQGVCGGGWQVSNGVAEVYVNETYWCADLYAAAREHGARFTLLLGSPPGAAPGPVPPEALANPQHAVQSAVALASRLGLDGFNIDDESECAPRADLANFSAWAAFVDTFADGLHEANLTLTVDVQAVFGITDSPYVHEQPCALGPWQYTVDPRVPELMQASHADAWIEMDTYYFGTSRYLDALDWYADNVPQQKLGVGIMNRNDIDVPDGYLARFHALEKSGANELHLWRMPVADVWLPYIQRWKSKCAGCPQLACYELSVECSPSSGPSSDVLVVL